MNTLLRILALAGLVTVLTAGPALALGLTVTITSSPVTTATAGEAYAYDVEAVSSDPAAVLTYTLRENPAGMSMNQSTGLITWPSALAGMHRMRVRVKARAADGVEGEAEQEFTLRVGVAGAGVVQGTVRDSAGAGLAFIEVKLFDPTGTQRLYRTRTDSAGAYAMSGVAPGTYLAKADPEDMSPWDDQWFDHVGKRELATPLVMSANGSLTANFDLGLRGAGDDAQYLISGTVRAPGGAPVAGALVSFLRRGGVDDPQPHMRGGSGRSRGHDREELSVRTDSTGRYTARLKAKTYVVRASAAGFMAQYWDHATSFGTAQRLTLGSDTSGVDFDLAAAGGAPDVSGAGPRGRGAAEGALLEQNYPNPFNPSTSIRFTVPAAGPVRLQIFNAIGQQVAELVNGDLAAGVHAVEWNAGTAASGIYFTRLEVAGATQVRRMQLLR